MILSKIRDLSLSVKVGGLATVFLLPLILLGHYFVDDRLDLVNFSALEVDGVRYLKPAHGLLTALAAPSVDGSEVQKQADALEQTSHGIAKSFDVGEQVSGALSQARGVQGNGDPGPAIDRATGLIATVADKSNLSRDPDMDSYYLTDSLITEIPNVVSRSLDLRAVGAALKNADSDQHVPLAVATAGMATAAGNFVTGIDKAIAGNPDGSLKKSLGDRRNALAAANDRLIAAAKAGDAAAIGTASSDVVAAAHSLLDTGDDELNRLLQTRINGFYNSLFTRLAIVSVFVLVAAIASFTTARSVIRPIGAMTKAMERLAGGDTNTVIPDTDSHNEIGAMAKAVQIFKDRTIEAARLRDEQQRQQRHQAERTKHIEASIDVFQKSVGDVVKALGAAAAELQQTAQSMSVISEETAQRSAMVATASEHATQNVQTVAAATEELSASISEIGGQVNESTRIAGDAVIQAGNANDKVQSLNTAVQKIGDVVKLISDIAGQTNLLALNATIEAARAGEAGKGFAVVASEVKNLATQTAKATEEVGMQIKAIQDATRESVNEIQAITQTIERVNGIATAIASAVEEQGAATTEIARNVNQAAQGTGEVSANIGGVREAAENTGDAVKHVLASIKQLSQNGETLKSQVEKFLREVRAA